MCKNEIIDEIVDRFGEDVTIYAYDMECFRVDTEVAVNKEFFMWVFGLDGKVKIKEPEDVKDKYIRMIKRVYKPYKTFI